MRSPASMRKADSSPIMSSTWPVARLRASPRAWASPESHMNSRRNPSMSDVTRANACSRDSIAARRLVTRAICSVAWRMACSKAWTSPATHSRSLRMVSESAGLAARARRRPAISPSRSGIGA